MCNYSYFNQRGCYKNSVFRDISGKMKLLDIVVIHQKTCFLPQNVQNIIKPG